MINRLTKVESSLQHLKTIASDQYIFNTVRNDRIGQRLSDEEIKSKIDLAKVMAKDLVTYYKETLKLKNVDELVQYLQLIVEFRHEKIEDYFAIIGFFESPNRIVINDIYRDNDSFWIAHQQTEWLFDKWSSVIIAHEAFHAIQEKEALDLSAFEIELWQLFGFKKKSPVTVLIEVMANYFAQYFTGVSYYPAILDNIALMPIYPEAVHEQIETLTIEAD